MDEYCIQALPEFEGKKLQNVAKEGLKLDHSEAARERKEALENEYKSMLDWLKDNALSGKVTIPKESQGVFCCIHTFRSVVETRLQVLGPIHCGSEVLKVFVSSCERQPFSACQQNFVFGHKGRRWLPFCPEWGRGGGGGISVGFSVTFQ